MNMEPMFSVIVPHYNSWDILCQLLNSIGIHNNMQIIVVDDHSDDFVHKVDEIKKEYPYVEIYQNQKSYNSAGACRNEGLKHAKGRWILFADADDYFENDFYEIIEKYVNAKEDMIIFTPTSKNLISNEISNFTSGAQRYIFDYLQNPSAENEMALRYKLAPPWSRMIKAEIIQQNVMTFDNTIVGNDVMFSVKCGYYCRNMLVVKDVIYCYTKGSHTLTRDTKEKLFVRAKVFVGMYWYLKKRLPRQEFEILNLRAAPMVVKIIKNIKTFGFAFLIKVIAVFIKNRVVIFTKKDIWRLFNGYYIGKRKKRGETG